MKQSYSDPTARLAIKHLSPRVQKPAPRRTFATVVTPGKDKPLPKETRLYPFRYGKYKVTIRATSEGKANKLFLKAIEQINNGTAPIKEKVL